MVNVLHEMITGNILIVVILEKFAVAVVVCLHLQPVQHNVTVPVEHVDTKIPTVVAVLVILVVTENVVETIV